MSTMRLALIGFGTVGQGLAQILLEHGAALERRYGFNARVVAVSDLRKGSVYHPQGLDAGALLAAVRSGRSLETLAAPHKGWDAMKTIRESEADAVAELSYTDLETGEPGLSHIRAALASGKHVVTSNKGPVALRFAELRALAREQGVQLGVEGTVMSGTPALRLGSELLAGAGIRKLEGILNGTTNYILSRMEAGLDYASALAEAQQQGYAEADPRGDVEGFDAAGKLVILAALVLGEPLAMREVARQGISHLTPEDVAAAAAAGERWKLLGRLEPGPRGLAASVKPERLPQAHPLAAVSGATNALTFTTELLGEVTLVGPGAGKLETGYALLADLLAIHRRQGLD